VLSFCVETHSTTHRSCEFVDPDAGRGTEDGFFMTDCVDCRPGMFSPVFADYIHKVKLGMK